MRCWLSVDLASVSTADWSATRASASRTIQGGRASRGPPPPQTGGPVLSLDAASAGLNSEGTHLVTKSESEIMDKAASWRQCLLILALLALPLPCAKTNPRLSPRKR
eukprot:9467028-Pyramimonas_sp.AAC.1